MQWSMAGSTISGANGSDATSAHGANPSSSRDRRFQRF
jgi:hypothetical protein